MTQEAKRAVEGLHAVWIEGSGSSAKLMYWNNTPTDEVSAYMAACNYAKYLPDYGINDGTGDKTIKRRVLQSEFVRAGKNVSWGYGEITSEKLTYEILPRINPTTGTGWVQDYYQSSVSGVVNPIKTTGLSQQQVFPPPIVIPGFNPVQKDLKLIVIPYGERVTYLSKAISQLKTMINKGSIAKPADKSEFLGCFDRFVWDETMKVSETDDNSKIFNIKSLFHQSFTDFPNLNSDSRFTEPSKSSYRYNPGVHPFVHVQRSSSILYALAWFYTHDIYWNDVNGNLCRNEFYGSKEILDYLLWGFSFIDRIKESNLYDIKINKWGSQITRYNGHTVNQWNDVSVDTGYEWFKDDWYKNYGQASYDESTYGLLDRLPTCLIGSESKKTPLEQRLPYLAMYSDIPFMLSEVADAWETLTYEAKWNDPSTPFFQYKDLWNKNEIPIPETKNGWQTTYGLAHNSWDATTRGNGYPYSTLSARDIIYRDLKYMGNFISWNSNNFVLYWSDPARGSSQKYMTSPNILTMHMAYLYKMQSITDKISKMSDSDPDYGSLKKVDNDLNPARYETAANHVRDHLTTQATSISQIKDYKQSSEGYYPEHGEVANPSGTKISSYGPDTGYMGVTLQYMGRAYKYCINDNTKSLIKNSANRCLDNWVKWFLYKDTNGNWKIPNSKEYFAVRSYNSVTAYSSDAQAWGKQSCMYLSDILPLAERIKLLGGASPFDETAYYYGGGSNWNYFSYWGYFISLNVRYFDEWKNPTPINWPSLPYEKFDWSEKTFSQMGAADNTQIPGSLNGANPDVLVFHDGQNYKIAMNYYYGRQVVSQNLRGTTVFDVIHRYDSLQTPPTTYRPFKYSDFHEYTPWSGGYATSISSAITQYNNHPDYWTATENSGGIVDYLRDTSNMVKSLFLANGGGISQDAWKDVQGITLTPNSLVQLTFSLMGDVTVQFKWYKKGIEQLPRPQDTIVFSKQSWVGTGCSVRSIDASSSDILSVRISFITESGKSVQLQYAGLYFTGG